MSNSYFIITNNYKKILTDVGWVAIVDAQLYANNILTYSSSHRALAAMQVIPAITSGEGPEVGKSIVSSMTLFHRLQQDYADVIPDMVSFIDMLRKSGVRDLALNALLHTVLPKLRMSACLTENKSKEFDTALDDVAAADKYCLHGGRGKVLFSQNDCTQAVLCALDTLESALSAVQDIQETGDVKTAQIDDAINDELHYIEMYPLSAPNAVVACKRMQILRRQRREIKDKICCARWFQQLFEPIQLEQIHALREKIMNQNDRIYQLRAPSLFQHQVDDFL